MEQFSLEKWLKDKSRKVVTRSGHNVRILCTDQRGNMPIVALVEFDTLDGVQIFYSDGKNESHREYDLFFADEGEELSEFEKELQTIISVGSYWTSDDGSISTCCHFGDKEIKKISTQILDLARKELQPEFDKKLKEAYNQGGLDTQEEITKCLPKWKKSDRNWITNICDLVTIVKCDGGDYEDYDSVVVSNRVDKDDYYIELEELLKLPKEE